MKIELASVALVLIASIILIPTAAAQTKAQGKTFEAPASALTPKGTVKGRMVSGGLSATCTSSDGKSTCTCAGACWAGETGCGCPGEATLQGAIKSGTIKFREQRTK